MIRDRNIAPTSEFVKETIKLSVLGGASLSGVRIDGWRAPYAGVIESAHVYCATLTDSDDSVKVDLHKGGSSILSAPVDPVAGDTLTALPGAAGKTFEANDVLKSVVTTGSGDAIAGSIIVVVRPYTGYPERQAARNGGVSIVV